jgi:hypothetical protein
MLDFGKNGPVRLEVWYAHRSGPAHIVFQIESVGVAGLKKMNKQVQTNLNSLRRAHIRDK